MRRVLRLAAAALGLLLLWLLAVWPPPSWYRSHWPRETAFMALRPGRYHPVSLDSISPHLAQAVIVGEDANFYNHHGIDYLALARALGYQRPTFSWSNPRDRAALAAVLPGAWEHRDRLRGASTITQQLAKNLYLSPSRNPLRKVKEAVTSWRIEAALDKRRIMELYLNIVELGDGIWGADAASRAYFDRPPARLTQEQAAALAGALPFPLRSNPAHRPGRMRWRQNLILRRLRGEEVEVPRVAVEEVPADTVALELPLPDTVPAVDTALVDTAYVDTAYVDTTVPSEPPPAPVDSVPLPMRPLADTASP